MTEFTYDVECLDGDFRVNEYKNGVWINQADNNWAKATAYKAKAACEEGWATIEQLPDLFPQQEPGDLSILGPPHVSEYGGT